MKTVKKILKINKDGLLVESKDGGRTWVMPVGKAWSWADISKGYLRESKKNYKPFE